MQSSVRDFPKVLEVLTQPGAVCKEQEELYFCIYF